MVRALGAHDEVLQVIEAEFSDVNLHVRGNELSISGPADAVQLTLNLVEEIRALAAKDTRITPQVVAQLLRMLGEQSGAAAGRSADAEHPLHAAAATSGPRR